MPTLDDQLARLLHDAAVEPDTANALEGIAVKRHRRAVIRRTRTAGVVMASLVLLVGFVALVWPNDSTSPTVARPPARGELTVQVADSPNPSSSRDAVSARQIVVDPEEGYLRGPVDPSGEFLSLSAYDRNGGSFKVPPSRVIRINADGHVLDRVDLQGEVMSVTEGEGARWVLTHDPIVTGSSDPEYWVKRIGPDGGLTSRAVPPGAMPNGEIVAGGGGVWVPVRDGVLRFDPATGEYVGKIAQADAEQRTVVNFGKGVIATSGTELVRLDPSGLKAISMGGPANVDRIVAVVSARGTWALVEQDGETELRSVDLGTGTLRTAGRVVIPANFDADGLHASGTAMWVTGKVDGRRALLLVGTTDIGTQATIDRYVEIGSGQDISVTVMPDRVLVTTVDGLLYRIPLPA